MKLIVSVVFLVVFLFSSSGWAKNKIKSDELKALKEELTSLKKMYQTKICSLEKRIAQLEKERKEEEKRRKAEELEKLKKSALSEVGDELDSIKESETNTDKKYVAKNLGLQAENPEISVTGDMLMYYRNQSETREKFNSLFRDMAIHFNTYLGPDTLFKAAFPVVEGGGVPDLGEAYIVRSGITHNMNLTLGKFRQQFGVVNRWHKHALDQTDFPLPIKRIFGDGGLGQTGLSFDWNLAKPGSKIDQSLIAQITKGSNGKLFSENSKGFPSLLLHYKNYRDLNKDAYFEYGITGMIGKNDKWVNTLGNIKYQNRTVYLAGLDLTYFREPTEKMKYNNFLWRTEFYYLNKGILKDDFSPDRVKLWGAYTNWQWKISRTREWGIRVDYFKPDSKNYNYETYAYNDDSPREWQFTPYVTYYPYPWMHYRLEFSYRDPDGMREPIDKRIIFQCVWAAGPHQHDRY